MEQQIQDLVDSIRKEGLEKANRERDEIITKARAEAEKIIADANANAAKMIESAAKECDLRSQSAKASLEQAMRDLSLSFKDDIDAQLGRILSAGIEETLDKDVLSRIVLSVIDAGLKDVDVVIAKSDADALVKSLKANLAGKLKNGLEIKAGSGFAGVRLASRDGSGYIDLSTDEIAALVKPHLSESVRQLVF